MGDSCGRLYNLCVFAGHAPSLDRCEWNLSEASCMFGVPCVAGYDKSTKALLQSCSLLASEVVELEVSLHGFQECLATCQDLRKLAGNASWLFILCCLPWRMLAS